MSISLKEQLAKLIFEYSKLKFHTCPEIENIYLLSFGFLECEAYNLDIELEMIKRHIELFNQGWKASEIDEKLDIEFENQLNMIKKYMEELDLAIAKKEDHIELSGSDLDSLNSLYLDLIYKLHPLLNPIQGSYEHDLFEEISDAFENYDLSSMRSLAILIPSDRAVFEDDDFYLKSINHINQEISNIKNSYPYNKKEILEDDELFKEYKIQLLDIVANNYLLIEQYHEKLEDLI